MSIKRIVDDGYCIGCGTCSAAVDEAIPIVMDQYGRFQADVSRIDSLPEEDLQKAQFVCPFSDDGPNEDSIGERLFSANCSSDSRIGYHRDISVGYVAEGDFRARGTSGGVITWALTELLEQKVIDAVVHVKRVEAPNNGVLFRYGLSRTVDEILEGAKSRYYPIEMSDVLKQIKQTPGQYAVVGIPCFIKAIRRLAVIDPVIKQRVAFCIGLVCGHLKSKAFSDCLAWQVGIPPGQLQEIDFRVKLPTRTANDYGVFLRGADKATTQPTRRFFGSKWGHNYFRYPACDYCDDVFAETADMAVGDAWLAAYENDPRGNSLVVVRATALHEVINAARRNNRLQLTSSTADEVAASQAGGLRDRREGLAYRLFLKRRNSKWAPRKRVTPTEFGISPRRRKIYQNRSDIGAASHVAWVDAVRGNSFGIFEEELRCLIAKNQRLANPHFRRYISRLKNFIRRILISG